MSEVSQPRSLVWIQLTGVIFLVVSDSILCFLTLHMNGKSPVASSGRTPKTEQKCRMIIALGTSVHAVEA